ncbi:hypothetical protein YYE_04930 [Plasmodium vinckei vinckei]|uniref:Serine aminopeptidase S33 domain-containing protein n=1 Tax=Plasmodium vinckei vinckei TaxID=54757 RepID=A0A081I964_PLAVN|nr:hypothetical protein YYE_04930 [Plasmodium vinckei vinckei]
MAEGIELSNNELESTTLCKLDGDPKVGWFRNKNGLLLKTYGWVVKNAVGIIFLIHGLKSHARLTYMKANLKILNINEDLVIDDNNYYIYKDSWIEKFNQHGYSVYALDLQGHGESQAIGKLRGNFNHFEDLIDDVIQYMNQIQDEISNDNHTDDNISNDNHTDDESHDIVTAKKKRLPMYVIGHSMGGNIALRILELLGKGKGYNSNAINKNKYKNFNVILDNYIDINGNDDDMKYMINSVHDVNNSNNFDIENRNNADCIANFNDCDSENSCFSAPNTTNIIISDKYDERYNCLEKLNIKGCASLSGMMKLKAPLDAGNKTFKYLCLPVIKFLSHVAPDTLISSESRYKRSEYVANVCKHDKFRNNTGLKFNCVAELIKAIIKLDCNIDYLPKDIPLLFIHSTDDTICCYKGSVCFYDKAKVNRKELHIVENMNHAITIEPGNEEILNVIIDWIHDLERNDGEEIENEIRDKVK